MFLRSSIRAVVAVLLCLTLVSAGVAAYGAPPPYLVKVSGPTRAVDCGSTVSITATVLNTDNGNKPVVSQFIRWSITKGDRGDALSTAQSKTDKRGRASTQLTISKALGDRRVEGSASGVKGRVVIKVDCVLPTPTPRPTARPGTTPEPTPKPTPRPTATPAQTPGPTTTAGATLSKGDLVVGYREADMQGRAPLLIADVYGLWTDAGLRSVTQVEAPAPLEAVLDGSLDVAVMRLEDAVRAIADGKPLRILSGYHQYRADTVVVADGIEQPADLAGRTAIVGDDANASVRSAALAAAGWEPATLGAEVTLPEGGFDAWVQAYLDGQVAMTPIRNQDRLAVDQVNGTIVLDEQTYGDDVLVTSAALIEESPDALVAFLTGTIGALRELADPATDEDLWAAARAAGLRITAGMQGGWVSDVDDLRPWDGSLGDPTVGGGLGELDAFAADLLGWVPLPVDTVAIDLLGEAQSALGIAPTPALPVLDAPASAGLRIDTPTAQMADQAPLLLATATDAFAAAGITDLSLSAGTGIPGILDGSLDLAVVTAADAQASIDAGDPIVVVAGYQPAATEPTVVVAGADRADTDIAPALAALLRGLAALNRVDAVDLAVATAGDAAAADAQATWPAIVAAFAPFNGSTADPAASIHPALVAARSSLGLVPEVNP